MAATTAGSAVSIEAIRRLIEAGLNAVNNAPKPGQPDEIINRNQQVGRLGDGKAPDYAVGRPARPVLLYVNEKRISVRRWFPSMQPASRISGRAISWSSDCGACSHMALLAPAFLDRLGLSPRDKGARPEGSRAVSRLRCSGARCRVD